MKQAPDAGSDHSVRQPGRSNGAGVVLSVVVPMYNEAEVLPLFVDRVRAVLDDLGEPYEVVAVDDGSRDATPVLLQAARREWPQLRVLRLRANAGHQAALSAGLVLPAGPGSCPPARPCPPTPATPPSRLPTPPRRERRPCPAEMQLSALWRSTIRAVLHLGGCGPCSDGPCARWDRARWTRALGGTALGGPVCAAGCWEAGRGGDVGSRA